MDAGAALIGRASELAELDDRLASRRLVTVIGPGGVGKTTMALAGARRVEGRYPHGTRFVDLARVQAPDAVAGAIAAQVGFTSFEALLAAPSEQAILVIVDNCEHVLDAAAFCRVGARRLASEDSGLGVSGPVAAAALDVLRNYAA